ncbi:MAG: hypothetical protein ABIN25_13330, partial [Ginsengibacter sp.]
MTAYNISDLYNRIVQQQASEAFRTSCISEESYARILKAHPDKLYTPNYFIRLALGALTLVAVIFTTALGILLFGASSEASLTALLLVAGIGCYGMLESMIKSKRYYNAGVDNVLMFSVVILIISMFFISVNTDNYTLISAVIAILCFLLCLRFTDAFMAAASYLAFFVFVFLLYLRLGAIAKATAPLLMMLVSAIVYFILRRIEKKERAIIYLFCINTVMFLTLLTFYASANYFVVKELSSQMFDVHLAPDAGIPFGWLFWILTVTIPLLYILYGVAKKDFLFIRTGLALVAFTVFTIRQYHTVLPTEIAMLIAGVLLISISYFLIRY